LSAARLIPPPYRPSKTACPRPTRFFKQTMKLLIVVLAILLLASLWYVVVWPIEPAGPLGAGVEPRRQIRGGTAMILGALIGGGSAALAAYLADRRRFKREDAAVRREVYAEFVLSWSLYKETERDLQQLAPGSPQKNEEAHRRLLRTFNALSLIAPTEVRAAAAEVIEDVEGAPGRFWQVARKDVGLSD
jgi:hypothetical protein